MNRASADLLGLRRPSGGVSAPLVEAIFPGFEFSNILAKHTSLRGSIPGGGIKIPHAKKHLRLGAATRDPM